MIVSLNAQGHRLGLMIVDGNRARPYHRLEFMYLEDRDGMRDYLQSHPPDPWYVPVKDLPDYSFGPRKIWANL